MSRQINLPPYRQHDPSPGERRRRRRVLVFVLVLTLGTALLLDGRDLPTVLYTVLGLGLAAATVARWVTEDTPLPGAQALTQLGLAGGKGR